MAQTAALVRALKEVLKARGVTYARLAKGLHLASGASTRGRGRVSSAEIRHGFRSSQARAPPFHASTFMNSRRVFGPYVR